MKRKFKIIQQIFSSLVIVSLFGATHASAESSAEKGKRIMEQVDQLPRLEKMIAETELDIYNSQGKKLFTKKSRQASFVSDFRNADERLSKSISYFYAPADDKGNGALMIEKNESDDDQWIYLKGLRKPKRIIGSDKSSSFMGSDFSNGDVSARDIDDSNYTWLATETIKFKNKKLKVEKIQGVFKDEQMRDDYGYGKSIVWMHVKSGLPFKMELFDLNSQLTKTATLHSFSVKKNKDGKRVFIPTSLEMKNVMKGTKTVMRMKNIKTGKSATKINPTIFKTDYLTRKWW